MEKSKTSLLWAVAGYELFAKEGLEGIQVERLARILQLNKSGFYHYFADLEGFCQEMIQLHQRRMDILLSEVRTIKKLDPDYLMLLVKHTSTVLFQVQITRNKDRYSFYEVSQEIESRANEVISHLWVDYLGSNVNPELIMRYYDFVRDTFYTRVSVRNFNFQFLHNLITEAKALLDQVNERVSSKASQTVPEYLNDSV